jgi:hypothetical protein
MPWLHGNLWNHLPLTLTGSPQGCGMKAEDGFGGGCRSQSTMGLPEVVNPSVPLEPVDSRFWQAGGWGLSGPVSGLRSC